MTRVVVTGGAGFLGSHLCERLLADGCEVVALDNFLTGTPRHVEHLMQYERFRLIKCDVTDYIHVPGPVDQVLHFASPASPIDYLKLPIETLKVGSLGTLHALGLAKDKGARFLLASTSETYGDPQVHPQPETYWGHVNPVGPRGVYDEAKRYAEALTMAYRRTHDVDTAIVRIFNTHDPRMRPNDGRAIPAFTTQALLGKPITVAGDGSQTRSIVYVTDLVEGIIQLLRSDLAGPVNIGQGYSSDWTNPGQRLAMACPPGAGPGWAGGPARSAGSAPSSSVAGWRPGRGIAPGRGRRRAQAPGRTAAPGCATGGG